ncbi:MAG: hypothetical protein ACI8Q1_001756 [Parvicella sp.]|jgi:hypothetical protein
MKELSLERMEGIGGGMSFGCGMALVGIGFAVLGVGALTGGMGVAALWLATTGYTGVNFMTACGPSDFE